MLLAENAGSRVTAEMNGAPYNVATVIGGLIDYTGGQPRKLATENQVVGERQPST